MTDYQLKMLVFYVAFLFVNYVHFLSLYTDTHTLQKGAPKLDFKRM